MKEEREKNIFTGWITTTLMRKQFPFFSFFIRRPQYLQFPSLRHDLMTKLCCCRERKKT